MQTMVRAGCEMQNRLNYRIHIRMLTKTLHNQIKFQKNTDASIKNMEMQVD